MSDIHIYILILIVIVSFQTKMTHFGWKKKKFPAKQRKTYLPTGRKNRFALAFGRKFSKLEIILFYRRVFGRESPSPTAISRWISRASPPSLPDTVRLSDLSAADDSEDEWGQIRGG